VLIQNAIVQVLLSGSLLIDPHTIFIVHVTYSVRPLQVEEDGLLAVSLLAIIVEIFYARVEGEVGYAGILPLLKLLLKAWRRSVVVCAGDGSRDFDIFFALC
jgi:hypothetical protein